MFRLSSKAMPHEGRLAALSGFCSKALAALCIAVLLSAPASAQEAFVINRYGVDISVGTDRVHHVKENLSLDFTQPRHGIIRKIPLESSEERYKIKNISVDAPFSVARENGEYSVKIGSADETVYGLKDYVISYDIVFAADKYDSFDLSYISPVGTQWDTQILSADIRLSLPGEITGFKATYGRYGSTAELSNYVIDGGTVTLSCGPLDNYSGVTLWTEMPEGTFSDAPRSLDPWALPLGLALGAAGAAAAVFVIIQWFKNGRDERIIPVVEFYPPDGLNPAEMEYAMKNHVSERAVSSMIFFWASKGFIEYTENGKNKFTLTRVKPMEGRPDYEKKAFDELFALGSGETVTSSQIEKGFHQSVPVVQGGAECSFRGKRILEDPQNGQKSWMYLLLCVAAPALAGLVAFFSEGSLFELVPAAFTLLLYGGAAVVLQRKHGSVFAKILFAVFAAAAGFVVVAAAAELSCGARLFGGVYVLILISSYVGAVFAALYGKRTRYAAGLIGRCMGFADFLKTAEKERLEQLIEENPSYYFDILPYAVILDVTTVWAKKFENLVKEPPQWYRTDTDVFTALYMSRAMDRSIQSIALKAAAAQAGSSVGGSLSGSGGFSGGGAGGGGGSSW